MFSNKNREAPITNSVISEGVFVEGKFSGFRGPLFVDGRVQGSIKTKHAVSIGIKGIVKGDIVCKSLEVCGTFEGNITSQIVNIYKSGRVMGDVLTNELSVESGGKFIGQMKDANSNQWDIVDNKDKNKGDKVIDMTKLDIKTTQVK